MTTVTKQKTRHSPPIRLISKELRPRFVNTTLSKKRPRFWIRSRRSLYGVVYCSESPPSNGQILPEQSSHDEIIVNHNNHEPSEDFPDESPPPPEPPQNPEMTWGSLIPSRLKVLWNESGSAQILKECFGVLKRNLWTLMSLTALNSATRFLLVWTLYKTVCIFAVHLFGVPATSIPQEMIPSSSSLGDPDVYQQVADITFLVFKPFDFVLKGVFIAAGLMTCNDSIQESKNPQNNKRTGLIRSLWRSFKSSLIMLWKSLKQSKEYMIVYIIAGALTAFYQGLALLLVPLLYALRRLMNIQLAFCATLFEGKKGKGALKHSTKMVAPIRRHLYFPYLLLLLAPKFLGVLRDMVVKVFPDRLFADVPEITWGLIACTTVTAFLIDRMADILPIVVFNSPLLQSESKNEAETN